MNYDNTITIHSISPTYFEKQVNRQLFFRRKLVLLFMQTRKFKGKDFTAYVAVFKRR